MIAESPLRKNPRPKIPTKFSTAPKGKPRQTWDSESHIGNQLPLKVKFTVICVSTSTASPSSRNGR